MEACDIAPTPQVNVVRGWLWREITEVQRPQVSSYLSVRRGMTGGESCGLEPNQMFWLSKQPSWPQPCLSTTIGNLLIL